MIEAIDQYAFASFPNAEISVGPMGAAGGSKYDVGVRVSGENPDKLMEIAAQIKRKNVRNQRG